MNLTRTLRQIASNEDINFLLTNRIPRIALTRFMGWFSRRTTPWVRDLSLWVWQRFTDLDLSDAAETRFDSLHACFTRRLKPGARTFDSQRNVLCSPSDGIVGAQGRIENDSQDEPTLLQIKGFSYSLRELLAPSEQTDSLLQELRGGHYLTLRLTSAMYHRFHAPADAVLEHVSYISGDTWNVNPIALKRVERLFCKNERAVLSFRLPQGQRLVLVPVAAVLVASMRIHAISETLNLGWKGPHEFSPNAPCAKGEELGYFEHGSTIIALVSDAYVLDKLIKEGDQIKSGKALFIS
jgi:phosphatidylserine decarboxylase